MAKIMVENLSKIFGNNPDKAFALLEEGYTKDEVMEKTGQAVGVYNASFTVDKGEIFVIMVIMGLSGSGKSTVIRCLNRLIDPTRGKIVIGDQEVSAMDADELREFRRHKQSMVFQRFALFPHRTVVENAAFGLEIWGDDEIGAVMEMNAEDPDYEGNARTWVENNQDIVENWIP